MGRMLCDAVDRSKHGLRRLEKLGRRWLTVTYGERPAMVTMLNEVNVGRRIGAADIRRHASIPCSHLANGKDRRMNHSIALCSARYDVDTLAPCIGLLQSPGRCHSDAPI